jgi:hypothetical protein
VIFCVVMTQACGPESPGMLGLAATADNHVSETAEQQAPHRQVLRRDFADIIIQF